MDGAQRVETPADAFAEATAQPPRWSPPRSGPKSTALFVVLLVAGVLLVLFTWGLPPFQRLSQTTENAYVRGQTTVIAPQVNGYITQLMVQDFQAVRAGQALARIDDRIYRQRVEQAQANVDAQAAKRLAEIDLTNTVVRAPQDGQVSELGVRLGQYVTAGSQLMFLVPRTVWVVANFKEAQTARMAPGQVATVKVDALGGAVLRGRVQQLAPAAGSEFSVIRPDNATGNFVKVAQRIAVRITIDPNQPLAAKLRPGMSVEARVDTGR